jgi:hypothetical protein
VFVRARRSATIRTRLDVETIRERLSALARGTTPPGGLVEKGHFLGGTVGADDFHFDFHFASQKDPQTYTVHGRIQDHLEWRILRLKVVAKGPWMHPLILVVPAGVVGVHLAFGFLPEKAFVVSCGVVLVIYALRNLLFLPDLVTGRVAGEIAATVSGSVQQGKGWVVPG